MIKKKMVDSFAALLTDVLVCAMSMMAAML